jgi:hypothetical protein
VSYCHLYVIGLLSLSSLVDTVFETIVPKGNKLCEDVPLVDIVQIC